MKTMIGVGKYYKFKTSSDYSIILKVISSDIDIQYIQSNMSNIFNTRWKTISNVEREATKEEAGWLDYCISINKCVPISEVPNISKTYDLW